MNSSPGTSSVASVARHRRPDRQFLPRALDEMSRDENVCLMLRTYIVVREDRDSDVTRRDGELICQPAWKFQTRSAVFQQEER
jgi:hypothetical protein